MDGQDNDSNKPSNDATSGGIFSTPELTVDAEKIAQPTPSDEQKRVASIFANTTTGQQAQKLNDAMEAQAAPITEDLVIQNEPRKRSKFPLIFAGIVLILAIASVVVWMVVRNNTGSNAPASPQTALEAFEDYRNSIVNGNNTENTNSENNDWFLYQLRNSGLNIASMKEYTNSVENKYNVFLGFSDTNLSDINMDRYGRLLDIFLKSGSLRVLQQEVLDMFVKSGSESAYQYIVEVTPKQPDDEQYGSMTLISDAIGTYLNDELTLYEIYEGWQCIENGEVSMPCVDDHATGHKTYDELLNSQSAAQQTIMSYTPGLQKVFTNLTEEIFNMLRSQ